MNLLDAGNKLRDAAIELRKKADQYELLANEMDVASDEIESGNQSSPFLRQKKQQRQKRQKRTYKKSNLQLAPGAWNLYARKGIQALSQIDQDKLRAHWGEVSQANRSKQPKNKLHWTQRPENRKKLKKTLKAMQKGFQQKVVKFPMGGVA
jgi:hypothetical protein